MEAAVAAITEGDEGFPPDKLHEECGVFGVFTTSETQNVVPLVYSGLLSLQHRGQESAGIAAAKNGTVELRKGMGLVDEVFG
ncbi:MAG: hypothetical protein LBK64_07465, partial [Spirochaetaceae bacterium]|nr:hypothetical protein [Spirochaetaceae bacterium]